MAQDHELSERDVSSIGDLNGTKPVTDRDSKKVMLRGERGDIIQLGEIIEYFQDVDLIPDKFEIVRRIGTYYGTELELKPADRENDSTYLITAPGPDTYLYLWSAVSDSDGFRKGWSKLTEVKASFADDTPKYMLCTECGRPIKTLEHERLSAIGACEKLVD